LEKSTKKVEDKGDVPYHANKGESSAVGKGGSEGEAKDPRNP